jgi:excisionase family DNA binding protein
MEENGKVQKGGTGLGHSIGTGEKDCFKNQKVKKAQGIYNPLPKRLYSLPEAAHYLGRTLWSIRELVWAGKLPIVRDGKRIFVDINDLNAYIEKNKTTYV